jgi:excinuclease ABC subunit A
LYIDQSAIGKNPRSCPATFIWVWDDIRKIFAWTSEAKLYWLNDSYFSFNSSKWACQECKWYGYKKIELQFLPDTYIECELCHGKRFQPEVLNITWNWKNVADILNMYIDQALDFFDSLPHIKEKLQLLCDIGLWYLKMGQPAHTLSWWESQRLKLVKNLLKKYKWEVIYFLDEPTVGLHFVDIEKLLNILWRFLERGDTIIMIEHDKNLLQFADKVIEMKDGEISINN